MQRVGIRLALTLGMLLWPLSALALVPPNITGIEARVQNGQIMIRWAAPEGENDINLYRLYYGQKSILENDGAYDDFLAVNGDRTELILTDLPPYPEIFISVVAVSGNDEESDSFMEEVRLDLTADPSAGELYQREAPSPARKAREESMLGLTAVANTTLNEIALTFTHAIEVPPDQASDAVHVTDDQGQTLKLHKLHLIGNTMNVETDPLVPGASYAVRVNPVVIGFIAPDRNLPLDPARSIGSFTAEIHGDPTPPVIQLPQIVEDGQPSANIGSTETEVHNFRTHIEPEGNTGRSTIIVGWDGPTLGIVKGYKLTPIVGERLGKTTSIGPETTVVRFRKIPGGLFRVAILAELDDGSAAGPTTVSVNVPGEPLPASALVGSVIRPTVKGALTSTGAGAVGIAMLSGAITGLRWMRRKRAF